MKSILKFKRLFAYSEISNKYFNARFDDGVNIIYGKNTSGKSTLFQAIIYTFGINDQKIKLEEIISEDVFFRVDFVVSKNNRENEYTIIRYNDFITIKNNDDRVIKFFGISGDSSREHIKLKEYIAEILGCSLHLDYSGKYKLASIEALFLPYYISQDIGWVYRHKSFRGLDFIKNFKEDFYDYYLGIVNDYDRDYKNKLNENKKKIEAEIKFLENNISNNKSIQLSKLVDESFVNVSEKYLEKFKYNKDLLIISEKKYLDSCNKLTLNEQRRLILLKIKRDILKQKPVNGECPKCNQSVETSLDINYRYFQDINDTLKEINSTRDKIKEIKSSINSLEDKIIKIKKEVSDNYDLLLSYNIEGVNYKTWLDNKVNSELLSKINKDITEKRSEIEAITKSLSSFKTDEDVYKCRDKYNYKFKKLFSDKLEELGVKSFYDERFYLLYKIPAFPKQGVELLKTLLAFNFSFIELISKTSYVHRLPLMMDAIFEGDIEEDNREVILKFINKNKPTDIQVILSIADSKNNNKNVIEYNNEFMGGNANLICIGDNTDERSFLVPYNNEFDEYLDESLSLMS